LLHKLKNTWGETVLVRRSANYFEEGELKSNHLLGSSSSDEMIVNLNVLGSLIKYRILNNLDSKLIITIHNHWSKL